jgi:hypothetical protein
MHDLELHEHYLSSYLQDRLPALGLDYDTYGSYLVGLIDNDNDNDNDENENHWKDILELLAASSESHADDANAWINLKEELLRRQVQYNSKVVVEKEQALQLKTMEEKERWGREIELAQKQTLLEKPTKAPLTLAQQAILDKYAYDESEVYDKDGNLVQQPSDSSSSTLMSNKDVAVQEIRKSTVPSKKDAQKETKQAKLDKLKLKEDRRKRAVKGERKS